MRPDRNPRAASPSELLGLKMLAARYHERRGATATDITADYGFGGPIPLVGTEIQQLLGLGRFAPPVIA